MGIFFFFLFLFSLFFLSLQRSNCTTVVVDGVTQWTEPTANVGDTIIFKHKNHDNLYIFRSKDAFNGCNFTQAIPLSDPNSTTYTWHPSRPGYFYFSFSNGSNTPCQEGQKLAVKITQHSPPANPPATRDGVVSPSPAYPWPFQPREKFGGGVSPAPAMSPIPFIDSNPAVPLPTGEVDSGTIGPLPTSTNHASQGVKVGRLIEGLISMCFVIIMVII